MGTPSGELGGSGDGKAPGGSETEGDKPGGGRRHERTGGRSGPHRGNGNENGERDIGLCAFERRQNIRGNEFQAPASHSLTGASLRLSINVSQSSNKSIAECIKARNISSQNIILQEFLVVFAGFVNWPERFQEVSVDFNI